jgi:hypothetical protein
MGLRNIGHGELTRALEGKIGLHFRTGRERNAWYVLDGKRVLRVTAPKTHPGSVPPGTADQIRKNLKLTTPQFKDLIACPISGPDYEQIIRDKGLV